MEKLIYLLNTAPDRSSEAVRRAVIDMLVPHLQDKGAYRITVNVADLTEAVARDAPGRLNSSWGKLAAAVSFWLDTLDTRSEIEPVIAQVSPRHEGYLVTESIVQGCERVWQDGERRPGIALFTALGKPAAASEEEFYYWWQIRHSQSSFRLHPSRWSYVRNAVARPLTPDAPAYRAIVLEHWRDYADYIEDDRFFGDAAALAEMWEELPHFCDHGNMVSGPMSEYSFAWPLRG